MDCEGYRDGQHCERCLPNHFFSPIKDEMGRIPCEPCNCDPTGMFNINECFSYMGRIKRVKLKKEHL
jgi:laminin beta 4